MHVTLTPPPPPPTHWIITIPNKHFMASKNLTGNHKFRTQKTWWRAEEMQHSQVENLKRQQRIDAKLHSSSNNCWNPDETLQSLQPQKTWQGAEKTLHTHKFKRLDRKQKKIQTTHSQVQNLKTWKTLHTHKFRTSKDLTQSRKHNTHSQIQNIKRLDTEENKTIHTHKFRASKDLTECKGELGSLRSTSMSFLELISLEWSSLRSSDASSFFTSASSTRQSN